MSPDSASCSTRAGSGVCGGASTFSSAGASGCVGMSGVSSSTAVALLLRPTERAVLEDRGVVGLVAHVLVDVDVDHRADAAARTGCA